MGNKTADSFAAHCPDNDFGGFADFGPFSLRISGSFCDISQRLFRERNCYYRIRTTRREPNWLFVREKHGLLGTT
jgi:hypothetical protein